jgi:hypothetical protein
MSAHQHGTSSRSGSPPGRDHDRARFSDPGPLPRGADLLDEDLDLIADDMRDAVIHSLRTHATASALRAELVRTLRWRLGRRPEAGEA